MDLPTFDVPSCLAALPLFSDLDAPELARLAAGCRLQRLPRGTAVFRVGEPCQEFHVNVSGQVKLYAVSPGGQEKVIEIIGPGHSFAEALMFTGQPYIVSAETLTDTLLLSVAKSAVLTEIEHDPRFALRMLAGISRRLHGLVRDVEAQALESGVQRVIGYLLHDAVGEPREGAEALTVSLPVGKATLASRLSLTPEYFSRVLHELEAAGLVRVERRDIHILDRAALAHHLLR